MLAKRLSADKNNERVVIVLIIVELVKCEQWHKSSESNKEFN